MIVALFALAAQATMVDRVAAVVGDEPIALSEIYDLGSDYIVGKCPGETTGACVQAAELEVLDALVERVLVRQTLAQLDLEVTGEEIDRGIDAMVEQYQVADRDALRRGFEAQGVTWDFVREQVADQIRMLKFNENVIKPRIAVSDLDIEDLYQRLVRDAGGGEKYVLAAFSVPIPADADVTALQAKLATVVAELNAGTRDWSATVAELGDGSRPGDGALGSFATDELAKPLQDAIAGVAVGSVTAPLVLGPQIMVIKVVATTSDVRPLADVRDQLIEKVYERKGGDELDAWYIQAKKAAAIRILLDPAT